MGLLVTHYTRMALTHRTPRLTAGLTATAFAKLTKNNWLSAAEWLALRAERCHFHTGGRTKLNVIFTGGLSTLADPNNFNCSFNVWGFIPIAGRPGGEPLGSGFIRHIGTGTLRLGTCAGAASAEDILDTDRIADTIAFTDSKEGSGTILGPTETLAATDNEGANGLYTGGTPANDVAELFLRNLGRVSDVVFDFFDPQDASDVNTTILRVNAFGMAANV